MKKILIIFSMLLAMGLTSACSTDDEFKSNYCFDGVFVQETNGRIVVWLNENPIDDLSDFSLCYVSFQKTDLPERIYKEGDHVFFRIKKYDRAYEDYKEGFYPMWGIHVRYNCVVEPC